MSHRLFLAVIPDDATWVRVAAIADTIASRLGGECRRVQPGRYHVTLHFLGAYPALPAERIAAARAALEGVQVPPFELVLDLAMSFPGSHRRPCVLGCSTATMALLECWQMTRSPLEAAGFGEWLSANFVPHLTLCYSDQGLPAPATVSPIRFVARELLLMHSAPGSAEYRVLARHPLSPII